MKNALIFLILALFLSACGDPTKNTENTVEVEPGTEAISISPTTPTTTASEANANDAYLGSWVGYFRRGSGEGHEEDDETVFIGDRFAWNRENKINISIDRIIGDSVIGHSVVAGNDRPFHGSMGRDRIADPVTFRVREPGDDKYDGAFEFSIEDGKLTGTWRAYGNISIRDRNYTLEKKTFAYNPNQQLEPAQSFVDWTKKKETKVRENYGDGEFDEWMRSEYASATEAIYEINASSRRLEKSEVENLKKGDLTIIRNTIYARHGYSFKARPLRVFFDAQPWYIPVHADIRADFTDVEKDNIKLLLTYEKNAAEYYDAFGRG